MEKSKWLYHHGITGQKWGVRRYQREDGSRTAAGKARRNDGEPIQKLESNKQSEGLSRKQKVAIGVGIGIAAVGVTAGVLAGKKYLNNKEIMNTTMSTISSSKTVNSGQSVIKNLEESTSKISVPKVPIQRTEIQKASLPKPSTGKALSDFEFNKAVQIDASGKASSVLVPTDKKGYTKAFAEKMSKDSSGKTNAKNYEYWEKYMDRKLSSIPESQTSMNSINEKLRSQQQQLASMASKQANSINKNTASLDSFTESLLRRQGIIHSEIDNENDDY